MMAQQTVSPMFLDESVLGGPVSRKTPVDDMSMRSSPGVPMAASTVMKTNKFQEYAYDDSRGSLYGPQQLLAHSKPQGSATLYPTTHYLDRPSPESPEQTKKKMKTKGLLDSIDSHSSSDIDNFLKTHNLSDMLEKMPSSNLSLSIQTDLGRDSLSRESRESIGLNNTGSSLGILSIDSMHDLSGSLLQIGSPTKDQHYGPLGMPDRDHSGMPDHDTTLTPDTPLSAFSNDDAAEPFAKFGFLNTMENKVDDNANTCKGHHSPDDISKSCMDCVIKSTHCEFEAGKMEIGAGKQELGTRDILAGNREIGAGKRESGAGKRESGSGKRESGAEKRELGGGKRESGAGKQELRAGQLGSNQIDMQTNDFDTKQIENKRSNFAGVATNRESSIEAKDMQASSMHPMYSGNVRRFPPEKLDSMFFEHSPMANMPRPGSGDGEEIFPPRQPSQGQEQSSNYVSLPNRASKSDGVSSLQSTGSELSFAGSSLPFKPSQKSPPLGARRPSEGSEGSWQDAAVTRQKRFTKSSHSLRRPISIQERLTHGIRGRAIGSESLDSSEIDTEDELDAVRKELEERNNYLEPADRECIGESDESSNDGRPGLEGGSSDENYAQYTYSGIQGPRESAEGEVIAPVLGDGGGGGDGMSDAEDGNIPSGTSQPSLTTMDFFHGINAGSINTNAQHTRDVEGQSEVPSRGQPVGNGTMPTPFRQVRFASKDEVNTLSLLESDLDYSRPSIASVSSDTSRGNEVEMPSMFINPNTDRNDASVLYASGNQLQASSIYFEEGESIFDDDRESMGAHLQMNNPFDQESKSPGQAFIGRSSLGDFGNMDITFSKKFSFGDDEFSHMETSARSSGSDHSSTRSSNASRRLTGNSCHGSQNGDDLRSSVYIDDDGKAVNDLAFRNSLPIMQQKNGLGFISFEDFISSEDVGVGEDEFIAGGDVKEMIDKAEESFQQEHIFRQDEHISPTSPPSGQFDWSAGNAAGVENILDRYKDDITGDEDFCRISIGTFMECRTEALGSLCGNGNSARPEFGAGTVISPTSGLPHALYDNTDTFLDDTSLQEAASMDEESTWTEDPNYTMAGFIGANAERTSKSDSRNMNDNTYNVTADSMDQTLTDGTSQKANHDSGLDFTTNQTTPPAGKPEDVDMTHTPAVNMSAIASAIVNASSSTKPQELAAMILALSNKPKDGKHENVSKKSELKSNQIGVENKKSNFENANRLPVSNKPVYGNTFEMSSKIGTDFKEEAGGPDNQVKQGSNMQMDIPLKTAKDQFPFPKNVKRSSRTGNSNEDGFRQRHNDHHKEKQYNPTRPHRIGDGGEDTKTSKVRLSNKYDSAQSVRWSQVHAMQCVSPYNVKKDVAKMQSSELYSNTSNYDKHGRQVGSITGKSDSTLRNSKSSDAGVRDFNKVVQLQNTHSDVHPSQSSGNFPRSQRPDGRSCDSNSLGTRPVIGHVGPIQSAGTSSESVEDMEKSDAMIVEMLRKARRNNGSQVARNSQQNDDYGRPGVKVDGQRLSNSSYKPQSKNDSRSSNNGRERAHAAISDEPMLQDPCNQFTSNNSINGRNLRNISEIHQSELFSHDQPNRNISTKQLSSHGEMHTNMQRGMGERSSDLSSVHTSKLPVRSSKREQLQPIENQQQQLHQDNGHQLEKHPKEQFYINHPKEAINTKNTLQENVPYSTHNSGPQEPANEHRKSPAGKKGKKFPGRGRSSRRSRDSDIIIVGQHRIVPSEFMSRPSDIMNETEDSFFNITQSQPNGVEVSPEHVTEGDSTLVADSDRWREHNLPPSPESKKSMSPRTHGRPSQESKTSLSPRNRERGVDSSKLEHLYSSSVSQSPPHNRHAADDHPHQPHHVSTASLIEDKRYLPSRFSNSSSLHGFSDQLQSLTNHGIPVSTFHPISDSRSLSIQPPKPTLLTSQSLLNNAVASQYLNDRPIMTSHVSVPSSSTGSNQFYGHSAVPTSSTASNQFFGHSVVPTSSTASNQFFGHGTIPPHGLHSTYSYGMMPPVSSGTHFLPVSSAHGPSASARTPFMSTLPAATTLPHFHGQSSLPHTSIVANLVVPRQLRFQGVCCVGIAAQATLPLHNPSSRWLQCSLEVVSVMVNGEETNLRNKPSFLIHPKTIISPHTTEEVKVIFMPKYPGIYIAEVHVASSPVVAESEAALVQSSPPQMVTIQGLAEKPNIEIRESDEGSIHFGNVSQNTSTSKRIMMVNCGRATVPIRIALISGSLMHYLSFSVGDKSNTGISTKPVHTTLAGHESQSDEPPSIAVWVHIKASSKLSSTSSRLGPPDVISGQLQVEFDTPEQHEYLAVLPVKGLVGIARLHAPRCLQAIKFTSSVGQCSSRNFPLKNAGNLRLEIELFVSRAKDLFSMVPEKLSIEPDEERDILLKYTPKEAPSEVESILLVQVLPNGPQYEVVMSGKATTTSSKSKEPSSAQPIFCNKRFMVWGGVPVGRALQQKAVLKNNSDTQMMKLKLSIRGNTQDFQLQSSFGQQEKLTDNRQVILKPSELFPVHILFAPTIESTMKATLVIKPIPDKTNTKFTLPLSGYGGISNIILNGLTHVGDTYLSNIMNVTAGQTRTLSFEALNTGARTAFVKVIPFADMRASEKLEPKRITIKPDEFILLKEKLQKITLTLQLTKTDSVLCSQQSHLLCAIGIFYGDEITRHQYRQAQKTGTSQQVVLSSSNPLKDVVFNKPFLNEENVDEKFNLPPSPNDNHLFYSCMSRLMVSLIGASKEADDSIQYEGDWTLKQTDDEMRALPKIKEIKKERWSEIISTSPPVKETQAPPSTHSAMHASPITPSSDSCPWSIQPEHLVLHVQSHTVSKGRVQVINSTDRSLSFELTWPGHCLTVTPQTGVVEPRSQILVLVSPSPSLASRGVQLPWGGSVYIKCDGNLKEIKVQIREDMALDTSIYPSRGLTSLDNQPSTPVEVMGVPKLPVSELIKVKSRTVSFEETKVGSISDASVEFKNTTNEVLRWCLSSFAPAYVKQDGGEIFRATYSAFRFAKQSGSILSGQEFKVLVTFIPREVGKYSQYWNLEYEPRERMTETQSIRVEMTAVATKDGPEKPRSGGGQDNQMVTKLKADPDQSKKDKRLDCGISINESEVLFPTTELNRTSMLKVSIRNSSDRNQEVKFQSPKSPFAIRHFKHVLKSQAYARLPISFKPTHPGKYSGLLVIQTNSNEQLAVRLEGEAV